MKVAVRKPVYGEDVAAIILKPSAKLLQFIRLAKLPRSGVTQAQPVALG